MKKSHAIAAIVAAAIAAPLLHTAGNKIEEAFRKATDEAQPTLPQRVDEITTWTAVSYSGASVTLDFKLDREAADLPQNALSLIRQNAVKQVCQNPSILSAMKADRVYVYKYQTADAKSLGQFEIRSTDCGE